MNSTPKDQLPEDSMIKAAKLKSLGIMPKGVTGCNSCDQMGYIHCKCPPKKGKAEGSGKEDSAPKDDQKEKDITMNDTRNETSAEAAKHKELKYSAPYSRLVPEFKITLENPDKTKLSEKEATALLKIFHAIQSEFEAFKTELQHQGISNKVLKSYTAAVSDNGTALTINIPNAKHHDAFIARLIEKKFLPVPTPKSQAMGQENAGLQSPKPSPFKLTPSPFNTR